jgi:probable HAF family extracellular repeat protein
MQAPRDRSGEGLRGLAGLLEGLPMFTRTLSGAGAVVLLAGTTLAQPQPRYSVVDLNTGFNSTPTGITNGGLIAGNYQAPNGQNRAFLWRAGGAQDAGTLGGTTQAAAVNEQGVVVGLSVNGQNQQRAVRIDSNGIADLGGLPGAVASVAFDINSTGWIVGGSMVPSGSTTVNRAAMWRGGNVISLGSLGGGQGEARGISDAGHVVGWATTANNGQHAFRWTEPGGMVDLGTLGGAGTYSFGLDVNIHGTVVGMATGPSGQRAFMWTPQTGMQDLGVAPGFLESWASAINEAGQAVGYSTALGADDCETVFEPTLWENGTAVALNQRIQGAVLHSVLDINDLGQIVGITTGGSAVLLVPVVTCTPDFNGDGDVGTDADIEAFFACLAGSCCQSCGSADFNGDGDVGTDADIESFFRVLGGGPC